MSIPVVAFFTNKGGVGKTSLVFHISHMLADFEDELSQVWQKCLDRDERAFRVTTSFWRVLQAAGEQHEADVVLMDLGPNLDAINRAALISADFIVMPLGPDLFSIQGLRNLGPRLRSWRAEWAERIPKNPCADVKLPRGAMTPLGYIVMQHSEHKKHPVKSYTKWVCRIPQAYREFVLSDSLAGQLAVEEDRNCLALLKNYRSLVSMAQEASKPIFYLKPGDGALGAHVAAVRDAYNDFKKLSLELVQRAGVRA
jgi:chromosome partitioning protein